MRIKNYNTEELNAKKMLVETEYVIERLFSPGQQFRRMYVYHGLQSLKSKLKTTIQKN